MTTPPTERLAAAEARHDQMRAHLEAARIAGDELRETLAKERAAYHAAGAAAELEGGERPSRATLTALEQELVDAEDRLVFLTRAVDEAARQVRHARADVLAEQAEAVRAESARRQRRIHELESEIAPLQREIEEFSAWIRGAGPVRAVQLDAEAAQLRRT